jgi:hexosaminidase
MGSRQLPLLEKYNGGYNYRIPPAGAVIENGAVLANTQFPNHIIRYTTDGSEPSNTSAVYNAPVTAKGIIKLKVFSATGNESYLTIIENK